MRENALSISSCKFVAPPRVIFSVVFSSHTESFPPVKQSTRKKILYYFSDRLGHTTQKILYYVATCWTAHAWAVQHVTSKSVTTRAWTVQHVTSKSVTARAWAVQHVTSGGCHFANCNYCTVHNKNSERHLQELRLRRQYLTARIRGPVITWACGSGWWLWPAF